MIRLDNLVISNQKSILQKFNDFLHTKTGFIFEEKDLNKLEARVQKRMGFLNKKSLEDYFNYLIVNDSELLELINHIIVNETTFFRHDEQYKVLVSIIRKLPEKYVQINILSAGCSTGEEPYSLAMFLKTNLPANIFEKIKITAIDISSFNIQIAKRGEYPQMKLDKIKDKNFIKLFFTPCQDDDNFSIIPAIRSKIDFSVQNLFTVNYNYKFNYIFCRNVMIYFSEEKRNFLINKYHSLLHDDGYFFIAPTESLLENKDKFDRIRNSDVTFYSKKNNKESFIPPKKSFFQAEKKTVHRESDDNKFTIKFAGVNTDYLDIELNGVFEMEHISKINLSLKSLMV